MTPTHTGTNMDFQPTGYSGQTKPLPKAKPCPFCGGNPKVESDSHRREFGRDRFRIVCSSCYAGTRWYDGPNEAWLMWNRRASE